MSLVDLRVELSASSHSFQIQVPQHASILNVKQEIRLKCPGGPKEDGQRVIWRGRFLRDDEKVADIWKSPDDARIIHLAVHPSAWSREPPTNPNAPSTSPSYPSAPHQPRSQQGGNSPPSSPPASTPLPLILAKHNAALHVITHGRLPPTVLPGAAQDPIIRQHTISVIQSYGWSWPNILDAEYPPNSHDSPEGIRYERVIIDNHPYLKLVTPDASPSPCQKHAFRVLSHTFALLAIPAPDPHPFTRLPLPGVPYTPPNTNLNHHLQQLGLPPLRVAPNQNPNQNPANDPNNPLGGEIRAIPLRALMVPLMMLTFRTMLLMYFFSPSKRPLFGVVLSAWILYEAWGAFRAVLGNGDQAGGRGGGNPVRPENNGLVQGQNGQRVPATPASLGRSQAGVLLDRISNINISGEDTILDTSHLYGQQQEPGMIHRVKTFVGLLVMTLHPAVWDRRRSALRRREGRVRTEAIVRETEPPATNTGADGVEGNGNSNSADAHRAQARAQAVARHEQRPRWVREYVQRVEASEWVDDA